MGPHFPLLPFHWRALAESLQVFLNPSIVQAYMDKPCDSSYFHWIHPHIILMILVFSDCFLIAFHGFQIALDSICRMMSHGLLHLQPIGSMYGIYANIWGILMVDVTIYSIHGSYGQCLWSSQIDPGPSRTCLERLKDDYCAHGVANRGPPWLMMHCCNRTCQGHREWMNCIMHCNAKFIQIHQN